MTREEAVEVIKDFVAYGKHVNAFVYKGSIAIPIEALNMAIAALDQEETLQNLTKPNKSDLISRQAAIDAVNRAVTKEAARWSMQELPSADRPTGHWIEDENPNLGVCLKKVYVCSNCGSAVGCQYFVRRSFCPACGADMRSKEQ